MTEANRTLIEKYIACYNAKDVAAMMELFTEDVIFESVSNTDGVTAALNKQELQHLAVLGADFFQERRQTPTRWVIGEDSAAVEIDYWGCLARDLPTGQQAGDEVHLRGASFFTFREGRICRLVDYM